MATREPIDPNRLKGIITHREAQEAYERATDPAEQLHAMQLHEQAAGLKPPEIIPVYNAETKQWCAEIPMVTGRSSQQRFLAFSLEGLVTKLAQAHWHASCFIAKQNTMLKDKFADDNSCFTVVDSTGYSL